MLGTGLAEAGAGWGCGWLAGSCAWELGLPGLAGGWLAWLAGLLVGAGWGWLWLAGGWLAGFSENL